MPKYSKIFRILNIIWTYLKVFVKYLYSEMLIVQHRRSHNSVVELSMKRWNVIDRLKVWQVRTRRRKERIALGSFSLHQRLFALQYTPKPLNLQSWTAFVTIPCLRLLSNIVLSHNDTDGAASHSNRIHLHVTYSQNASSKIPILKDKLLRSTFSSRRFFLDRHRRELVSPTYWLTCNLTV